MLVEEVVRPPISSRAFNAAVLETLPALSRFARRLTRDEVAGDDLVQDALTRAWAARYQFQPGTNFRAWLFTIMRNQFLSLTRKAWRTVEWDPERHERLLTDAGGQERALNLLDLQRAVAGIADSHREVLNLLYVDQLTMEQAAASLGIRTGAMRSRAYRARAALHHHYGAEAAPRPSEPPETPASGETPAREVSSPGDAKDAWPDKPREGRRASYERWKAAGSRLIG